MDNEAIAQLYLDSLTSDSNSEVPAEEPLEKSDMPLAQEEPEPQLPDPILERLREIKKRYGQDGLAAYLERVQQNSPDLFKKMAELVIVAAEERVS